MAAASNTDAKRLKRIIMLFLPENQGLPPHNYPDLSLLQSLYITDVSKM
jgi:hypothetical protein